jgi:phage I-like protein
MTTPFQILQDDWVLVTPLGDYAHQMGIQRLTADGIAAMANRFNSFASRLGRLFGGVPLFEGHHDTDPELYPNGKSFAWVMELQNRADGLWARLKWTDEGRALIQNGNYKFLSPVWNAREAGRENGRTIYIPESLLSLALTNLPNLPLPPLANNQSHMKTITELLELPTDANPDAICEAVTRLKSQVTTLGNESENLRKATDEKLTTLQNTLSTQTSALSTAQSELAAHRTARIGLILANAIRDNRITLAEKDQWLTDLTASFETKSAEIESLPPKLNTQSVTRELGNEKAAYDTEATRRAALTGFIEEKMANGLSYDDAWLLAKVERADIFANMVRK